MLMRTAYFHTTRLRQPRSDAVTMPNAKRPVEAQACRTPAPVPSTAVPLSPLLCMGPLPGDVLPAALEGFPLAPRYLRSEAHQRSWFARGCLPVRVGPLFRGGFQQPAEMAATWWRGAGPRQGLALPPVSWGSSLWANAGFACCADADCSLLGQSPPGANYCVCVVRVGCGAWALCLLGPGVHVWVCVCVWGGGGGARVLCGAMNGVLQMFAGLSS